MRPLPRRIVSYGVIDKAEWEASRRRSRRARWSSKPFLPRRRARRRSDRGPARSRRARYRGPFPWSARRPAFAPRAVSRAFPVGARWRAPVSEQHGPGEQFVSGARLFEERSSAPRRARGGEAAAVRPRRGSIVRHRSTSTPSSCLYERVRVVLAAHDVLCCAALCCAVLRCAVLRCDVMCCDVL